MEHLEELRTRIVRCLIAIGIGFCATYAFKEELFAFLIAPLTQALGPGQKLHQFAAMDALLTYLKVSIYVGLFAVSPYLFYEIWKFVAPGLYESERRLVIPFVVFASLFFVGGAAFGYSVFMPFTFKFLLTFQTPMIENTMDLRRNFDFALQFLLIFAVVFELPMAIFFFARIGLVTHRGLLKVWRYVVVGSFVVSAIITPTVDPFTQTIVAAPLIVLYFLGIGVAWLFGKPRGDLSPEAPSGEETAAPEEKQPAAPPPAPAG